MTSIRERVTNFVFGAEKRKIMESAQLLIEAYKTGPYILPPEMLMQQLKETDSAILADMVTQMYWEQLGSLGSTYTESDAERVRAIDESRRLWKYDPLAQWMIWLRTGFGFGESISIIPQDDTGKKVWAEFWEADRNQAVVGDDELAHIAEEQDKDGENFFLFFFSKADGLTTIRKIDPKEITEIITHPDDALTKLLYKRVSTSNGATKEIYYQDWMVLLTDGLEKDYVDQVAGENKGKLRDVIMKDKTGEIAGTEVTECCVLHAALNKKGGLRGWPLFTAGSAWLRAHKDFRQDRLSVARGIAMQINKLKVQGGSRAVDAMKSKIGSALSQTNYLDTNPPGVAGGTWIENQSADLQRLSQNTGAGDAKTDGEALLLMAGLSGGVYPHYIGAGDAYRLATSQSMEQPMFRQFSRYRQFWATQFRRMVRIVLWAATEWGGKTITDFDAEVSTEKIVGVDVTQQMSAINSAMAWIEKNVTGNLMPPETANKLVTRLWSLALQALNVGDADEVVNDDTMYVEPAPEVVPETTGEEPPGEGTTEPPEVGAAWGSPAEMLWRGGGAAGEAETNPFRTVQADSSEGGPGSGNFGHEGRPGQIGGSGGGGGALADVKVATSDIRWKAEDTIKGSMVIEYPDDRNTLSKEEVIAYLRNNPPVDFLKKPEDIEDISVSIKDSGKGWAEVEVDITPSKSAGEDWLDQMGGEEEWGLYHQGVENVLGSIAIRAMLAEFTPGQSLEEVKAEYSETLYGAMSDYIVSEQPITSFRNVFRRAVNDGFTMAFYAGWAESNPSVKEVTDEAIDWLTGRIEQEITFADGLFGDLRDLRKDTEKDEAFKDAWITDRAEGYTNTLDSVFDHAKILGAENLMLTFGGEDGEVAPCTTCQDLKGKRMPAKWWVENDLIPGVPGSESFLCKGYKCRHFLSDDEGNVFTVEKAEIIKRIIAFEKGKE